ncbi:MAG: hypothetical protein HGA93_01750 [Methanothrix sp.]|nr:hypothetical protein [Methanothrix sp.]
MLDKQMLRSTTIALSTVPERARLGAELQELYGADEFDEILAQEAACLPKDATGNFITDQESRMWCTICWPSWRRICGR